MSGDFGTSFVSPKYLGAEVSLVRSIRDTDLFVRFSLILLFANLFIHFIITTFVEKSNIGVHKMF